MQFLSLQVPEWFIFYWIELLDIGDLSEESTDMLVED